MHQVIAYPSFQDYELLWLCICQKSILILYTAIVLYAFQTKMARERLSVKVWREGAGIKRFIASLTWIRSSWERRGREGKIGWSRAKGINDLEEREKKHKKVFWKWAQTEYRECRKREQEGQQALDTLTESLRH